MCVCSYTFVLLMLSLALFLNRHTSQHTLHTHTLCTHTLHTHTHTPPHTHPRIHGQREGVVGCWVCVYVYLCVSVCVCVSVFNCSYLVRCSSAEDYVETLSFPLSLLSP